MISKFTILIVSIFLLNFFSPATCNKCYPRVSLNSPCAINEDCLSGLYCEYYQKKCLAFPSQGSPCGNQVYCAATLGCSSANTCQSLSIKGQDCMLGETGYNVCSETLGCYFSEAVSNKCDDLKVNVGDPCTADNKCGGGLGCNFDNTGKNFCIQKKSAGGSCNNNDVCLNGYCDFTQLKCLYKKTLGEVCKSGECENNLSCLSTKYLLFFTRMTCQNIPTINGSTCDDKCAGNLVCKP